jgi:BirA family biotin operon repressor/biotin-[acetyl-CoA-carboxylase] ligase
VTDVESRTVQNVIIGIGVNIRTADFPEGVAAVSLNAEGITRNRLAAEIAGRVLDVCERPGDKTVLDEYRAHSLVLGRAITYTKNGVLYHAKATGIDDSGGLIICGENGETDVLRSGEISVRLSE